MYIYIYTELFKTFGNILSCCYFCVSEGEEEINDTSETNTLPAGGDCSAAPYSAGTFSSYEQWEDYDAAVQSCPTEESDESHETTTEPIETSTESDESFECVTISGYTIQGNDEYDDSYNCGVINKCTANGLVKCMHLYSISHILCFLTYMCINTFCF